MDHGTNRGAYLDGIFRAINWAEVNDRYAKLALTAAAR
jgi:superoxide dismutase